MPLDSLPTSSPVIERLRQGRAAVARFNGWCQNVYTDRGRVCSVAAVGYTDAISGHALRYLKIALVGRDTPEMVPNTQLISGWQDVFGREQHEVVALFDGALEAAIEDQLLGGQGWAPGPAAAPAVDRRVLEPVE